MKLISEFGVNMNIDSKKVPKDALGWSTQRAYLFDDGVELERCWVATLYENDISANCGRDDRYEYVATRIYDHEPSQNEILMFMAKYNSMSFSYVKIDKSYRLKEKLEEL